MRALAGQLQVSQPVRLARSCVSRDRSSNFFPNFFPTEELLTPQAEARLAGARPVNPEAYEAYLKGRFQWSQLSPENLETAVQYFELALEIDPNYALAYTGIAFVGRHASNSGLCRPARQCRERRQPL